jgi:iron complex outermembrane receptor protein
MIRVSSVAFVVVVHSLVIAPFLAARAFAAEPTRVEIVGDGAPLEPGEIPREGTGSKVPVPPVEIPQSIQVIDSETLNERGVADLNGALQLVPGITPLWTYGGFQAISARGFSDVLVLRNGLRDDRSSLFESAPFSGLWNLERIEVLQGPASVLYGYGSLGGVVNLILKRPSLEPGYSFDISAGNPDQRRLVVSATGPLGSDKLLYRLDAGTIYRKDERGATTWRNGVTGTLEYAPHLGHFLALQIEFDRDRYNTDTGLPTVDGLVPDTIGLHHRFNSPQDGESYWHLGLRLDYRWQVRRNLVLSERMTHEQDHYTYFSTEELSVSVDRLNVDRGYFYLQRNYYPLFNQLEAQTHFKLLVPMQVAGGYEFSGLWSNHPRSSVVGTPVASIPIGLQNEPDPQPAAPLPISARDTLNQFDNAIYLHDHVTLPHGLRLVLGGRLDVWQRYKRRDQLDPESGAVTMRGADGNFTATAFTYRVGLVYTPRPWTGTYISYATAFTPTAQLNADGSALLPTSGWQTEVGEHIDLGRRVRANAAYYYIEKHNVVIDEGMGNFSQAGLQRSQGIELSMQGRLTRWFALQAGYAWTDATFVHFTENGANLAGKRPQLVSPHTASLWATFLPISWLRLSVGGRVMARMWADDANTVNMPSFATLDASAEYRHGHLIASLLGTNLNGVLRYYTSSINGTQLTPGPGREFLARLRFEF